MSDNTITKRSGVYTLGLTDTHGLVWHPIQQFTQEVVDDTQALPFILQYTTKRIEEKGLQHRASVNGYWWEVRFIPRDKNYAEAPEQEKQP